MGQIRVILTGITSPNDFRVYYKRDDTGHGPYPITGATWIYYTGCTGGTTVVRIDENIVTFENDYVYWIKLEEVNNPKRYLIKNIKIHGDRFCPDILVTPTVTPTISLTPSITPSISLTPSTTPSIVVDVSPSVTPTRTASRSVTPSMTSTMSLTPTQTPSVSPQSIDSEIYFASVSGNNTAIMGVNNALGRTFNITLHYELTAEVDNNWSCSPSGGNAIQTTTQILISTNGGTDWTEIDSLTASIPGGDCQYDSPQPRLGYYTIPNITNVSQVRVQIAYDCASTQDLQRGSGYVIISSVTVVSGGGSASIICDNEFSASCTAGPTATLYCNGGLPSLTPTMTPSITRPTPSVSETLVPILISNQCTSHDYYITGVTIGGGIAVYEYLGANAIGPTDSTTEYFHGNSTYSLSIGIMSPGGYTSQASIQVVDSIGTIYTRDITTIPITISDLYGVSFTSAGNVTITMYDGAAPSLTPSVTVTPGLSPTITPTITPSVSQPRTEWYYNVDFYDCDGFNCSAQTGSDNISVSQELSVGSYYLNMSGNQVIYVQSEESYSANPYSINGSGYGSCQNACIQM